MTIRRVFFICVLASGLSSPALAGKHKTWADISDVGVFTLMGSALAIPSAKGDWQGLRQSGYSLVTAGAVSKLGKALVHEQRPDNSDNNSFPSGHSAMAFASATTLYKRYGWQTGVPAYALATLTATARVAARKHHWYDVVAGAIVGGAPAWFFTDAFNNKVRLVPWIDSTGGGVTLTMRW